MQRLLQSHCTDCHGSETQEAGLRFDSLTTNFAGPKVFSLWVRINDVLRSGQMPPKDASQPSASERKTTVDWLNQQLSQADTKRQQIAGRGVLRRMNRTEYEFTLRDLFDLPGLPVRDLLPEDSLAYGYDKSGDGLELSHVQLAKYMEAADLALSVATAAEVDAPEIVSRRFYPTELNGFRAPLGNGEAVLITDGKVDETILPMPGKIKPPLERKAMLKKLKPVLDEFQGSLGIFRREDAGFHPKINAFTAIHQGMYRLRISVWSYHWNKGELQHTTVKQVLNLRAGPRGFDRKLAYFDVPSLQPTPHEIVVWLNPGDQVGFNGTTLPFGNRPGPKGRIEWEGEGIAVDWLDVEGPLDDDWPTTSHRRLFGDVSLDYMDPDSSQRLPDHAIPVGRLKGPARGKAKKLGPWTVVSTNPKADSQRLLADFLPRAFRRPVSDDEVARYVGIVEQMLTEDLTFEDSLRWAYKTALCSPEFLFFAEPPGALNDFALASRISYFLWSSQPDGELIQLAEQNRLHDPAELRAQVERMLADEKSRRFVNDFVDQWLDLRDIDATTPDRKLYPEFNSYLRDSMVSETRAFFRQLLAHDRSVLNFVDSDFAMLNQRMAEHYGIESVHGATFREVALPPDCHRGGVVTQASVLKVTANGTTTTPVKRGSWVLRELLGQPPKPPPPNIPAVEPDVSGVITIRDQLDKHRSDAACASCHADIDPPGFALESFDVIGGWRTRYRSVGEGEETTGRNGRTAGYLLSLPVDSAGELANGETFHNIDELQQLLLKQPETIARNVIAQLVVYATGSEIGFADRAVVDDIINKTRAQQFGLRSIIHEVVQSKLFKVK